MTSEANQHRATKMYALVTHLYPICRSITGDGVRETLRIIRERVPIEQHEVASGTPVLDWTVPREWNIRDAWIKNEDGERVVDFRKLNLHVLNYSVPIRGRLHFSELRDHLFILPEHPDWVPYRTSYYQENWGFCLSARQLAEMSEDAEYEVCVDSCLKDGTLSYGEYLISGREPEEFLISCHVCHPSLANDNLSGIAVAVELANWLRREPRRYSYRFLFIPGTIGSITWLARNEDAVARIRHGLVLTCVGDAGNICYKRSRRGSAEIDRAFAHVLQHSGETHRLIDFNPYGYDERQYCSPGFDLPVGCMMRSQHGQFPEYHSSGDNLDFVGEEALLDSFLYCQEVMQLLEHNRRYINTNPRGEPQLGKRGLYRGLGVGAERRSGELALLWVLNLSDGAHDLLQVAERSGLAFKLIKKAADALQSSGLLSVP